MHLHHGNRQLQSSGELTMDQNSIQNLKRPILKSGDGFSLVEVMIAMGILIVAILGISQYSKDASRASKSNQLSIDLATLLANVQFTLNSSACSAALQGVSWTFNPTPAAPLLLNPIVLSNPAPAPGYSPTVIAQVGFPPLGAQVTKLEINNVLQDNVTVVGNFVQKVVQVHLAAKKVVSIVPAPGDVLGSQTMDKEIQITIWVDQGPTPQIMGCVPPIQNPAPQPSLATQDTCFDTTTPITIPYSVIDGAAWVTLQPTAPCPYPIPSPSITPNLAFAASVIDPAPIPLATATYPPAPVAGVYQFYMTAYNASVQPTLSGLTQITVNATACGAGNCAAAVCGTPTVCWHLIHEPNAGSCPASGPNPFLSATGTVPDSLGVGVCCCYEKPFITGNSGPNCP